MFDLLAEQSSKSLAQLIVFRSPAPEGYQSQEVWTQSVIYPLAFPDMAISVDRLLGS